MEDRVFYDHETITLRGNFIPGSQDHKLLSLIQILFFREIFTDPDGLPLQ